jgi:glycosyltransferase involved in cell wall biosynthesis
MLSLLMAVRDWPTERIESSVASFAALSDSLISEIIVLDFGSRAPIELTKRPGHVRVIRVEARRWSLAEATNAAVLAASGDVLAKTDADILLSPASHDGVADATRRIASGEYDILLTQNVNLPEAISLHEAVASIASGGSPEGLLRPRWGQGSLTFFSRATWARIGGYDSRLTGWGEEDNDFCDRARRSGSRIGWMAPQAIRAFHVWHPPTYHQTHVARERLANHKLLQDDKTILRRLRFINSDVTPLASPAVLRRDYPMVSVAIATSARPRRDRMIIESIRSFRSQIGDDFEIVVVDNGSDDDSHAALKSRLGGLASAAPIRLERQRSASIPKARNEISRMARGRFICVIDDDDIALPNRLADHLRSFEADGLVHGSQGGWIDYDEESGLIEKNAGKRRSIATMLKGTGKSTNHPSSFYRTDVMRAVPYDESLVLGADWDMALRMATLGMRIASTMSYVTLRRFHAANVTLTGTSNQVSTGLRARSRTWSLYNPRHQQALLEAAMENDTGFEATNELAMADLLELLPSYAGIWRVFVPFSALAGGEPGVSLLESALGIVDGDVATLSCGIAMPVMFCSAPVRGAGKARRVVAELARLTGTVPGVISERQLQIDRNVRFDWADIAMPDNGAMVLSGRLGTLAEALETVGALPPGSLLQSTMRIVSDFDDEGEAYYVMAPPTDSRTDAQEIIDSLRGKTPIAFRFARAPHLPSIPTVPVDRFH